MADQEVVTVTTTATELVGAGDLRSDNSDGVVYVYNGAASADIFVGDSGVTTVTGIPVGAGKTEVFRTSPGRNLYAIVASGSESVRFLIR